jgi:DNA mismatch repair protein MutL
MSVIRILPEDVSNRIAAGEVIERPASIVKELVENALDAGARRISIAIERGGRALVRVADDGCGMDPEDALLCLEAHATSKIRSNNDIECINTLGFRGEAMPSIASVSRFTLVTRPHDAELGTEVVSHGGVIYSVNEVGAAPGTSVTVKKLFYNMPARRKFLRTVATEETHIESTTLALALAHPDVGFDLTFDGRAVIAVRPGSDRVTRTTMLLGRDTMQAMIPVDFEGDGIHVTGFTARPGLTRSSRKEQRSYVNGRPVTADPVYHAIRDAYHTLVMKGRYAPTLLFIALDPDRVDINVHPAKREVRFRDNRTVTNVVSSAIRKALQKEVTGLPAPAAAPLPTPAGVAVSDVAQQPHQAPLTQPHLAMAPPLVAPPVFTGTAPQALADVPAGALNAVAPPHVNAGAPVIPEGQPVVTGGTSLSAANRDEIGKLKVLGALSDLFLVAEGPRGMVLIDQHAAHERVMYEKFLAQARDKDGTGQGLLMPITLEFSAADANSLRKNVEQLRALGFDIDDFGGNTFIVAAVPAHFPQENIGGMLRDILDTLHADGLAARRADEDRITMAACKAAVKAHDHLRQEEIDRLLEELVATELPYTCPHGRPTMINIPFSELDKRFGRRV